MIAGNESPVGLWTWISLSVRHGLRRSSGVQAGRDLGAEWFPRLAAQQNHWENFRSVQVPGLSFRSRGSQMSILEPSQLEKEMASHSSIPAWRIPGTGEPGGLPSMGSHKVGHNWSDLAAAGSYSLKLLFITVLYTVTKSSRHNALLKALVRY